MNTDYQMSQIDKELTKLRKSQSTADVFSNDGAASKKV